VPLAASGNNSREAQRQPGFRRIAGRPLRRDYRGRSGRRDGGLHYTTSKAAVIDLTRGLAQELGRDRIRVNALAPSAVLTDGIREFFGDRLDRALDVIKSGQSIQRNLTAPDLVGAAIWLVSDASLLCERQTIAIDRGTVML
jgi:p-cumic alcohol dehydrogenase